MCEVVFSGDETNKAIWYRDGEEVGIVSSNTNAIFENRSYTAEQPVPEVGFLIMSNITKGKAGLGASLQEEHGHVRPEHPLLGEQVMLVCPLPRAVPQPTISWLLNGEPVVHTSMDAQTYPNGTLFIRHFSTVHNGVYECVVWNFAARTSGRIVIDSKQTSNRNAFSQRQSTSSCSVLFRSSVLWFLVGCLVTSCSVLIYLLCALVLIRPSSRATMVPSMWARSNPLLGPGFRKVIVPVPDFITRRAADSNIDRGRSYEDV
ncbi:immunoglobulin domain protein [Cooperia oncophora]